MKKKPPTFATEDEEREFWVGHDSTEYVDWSRAKSIELSGLRPSIQADGADEELCDGST
jgi:hypothetical protein